MSEIKKEKEIYDCLKSGLGIRETIKKTKSQYKYVRAVADKYIDELPSTRRKGVIREQKIHIGARFDGPLTKKVLGECERLGINRSDFLEMVTKCYFDKMDDVYGEA